MKLSDLVERAPIPVPWGEADNIPWNEPAFSERMLAEHLSQDHDAASRRFEIIDDHVRWIHQTLLKERPQKLLDLACGPGLYASRLGRLGHTVTGIDFSPASIRYARQEVARAGLSLACTFIEADLRKLEYGVSYDFAMLIFGEFNTFKPVDATLILERTYHALRPGGILLLEPQNFTSIHRALLSPSVWRTYRTGLFSNRPYLYLQEDFWDDRTNTVATRYWIVDAETAEVNRYAQTTQAYQDTELEALLARQGFSQITFHPSLSPREDQSRQDFFAVTAIRS